MNRYIRTIGKDPGFSKHRFFSKIFFINILNHAEYHGIVNVQVERIFLIYIDRISKNLIYLSLIFKI